MSHNQQPTDPQSHIGTKRKMIDSGYKPINELYQQSIQHTNYHSDHRYNNQYYQQPHYNEQSYHAPPQQPHNTTSQHPSNQSTNYMNDRAYNNQYHQYNDYYSPQYHNKYPQAPPSQHDRSYNNPSPPDNHDAINQHNSNDESTFSGPSQQQSLSQQPPMSNNQKYKLRMLHQQKSGRAAAALRRELSHMNTLDRNTRELEQTGKKFVRAECKFWLNGACNKGDKCKFTHIGTPEVKKELCRYILNNKCEKGSNCYYSHDISTVPCRFWHLYGKCAYYDTCPFIHGAVSDAVKHTLIELEGIARKRKRGELITADEQRKLDEQAAELKKQEEIRIASIVEVPHDPFAVTAFD